MIAPTSRATRPTSLRVRLALMLVVGVACLGAGLAQPAAAAAGAREMAGHTGAPAVGKPVVKKKPVAKKKPAVARRKPAPQPGRCLSTAGPKKPHAAAKKPVAKKPAGKHRTVVRKPAGKKSAVKKPAAKKPAAKKPATRVLPPCRSPKVAATVPALPAPAGALLAQPGPVSAPADAPIVPSSQALGRTSSAFFGTHVFNPASSASWPGTAARGAVASVRLWDTGTSWSELEPAPDVWSWQALDAAVDQAQAHGFAPLLVLGQTPTWASSDPRAPGVLEPGGSVVPRDMATWRTYVSTVAQRYAGRIAAYEIWNEPNFVGDYFHGTEADLADLSSQAYDAVKAADPAALVLSPAMATRTKGQLGWAFRYFDLPAARKIDVVSLHLYPLATQLPEDAVAQLATIANSLAGRGLRKPVWNTEVNYGVVGGSASGVPVAEPLGSAFVARTLLMDRAAGVDRVFWYGWAASRLVGITVADVDGAQTPAAVAWTQVSHWLTRSTLVGCNENAGLHACTLRPDAGGWAQVVWQTDGESGLRAPGDTAGSMTLDGSVVTRSGGDRISVTSSPVLVFGGGARADSLR